MNFYVKRWGTDEVLSTHSNLPTAKKYARGNGHTGEDLPFLTGFPPIAYVANEAGECVYNPRFGKSISAAVGNLVNSRDSSSF